MRSKKSLRLFAFIIPVVLIGVMIYLFFNFQKKKQKVEALKNIPVFSVKDIHGNRFTNKDLPEGNKMLVYFNPQCEYCQAEMEELSQINGKHKNINWVLFSTASMADIQRFAQYYHLDTAKNIKWCQDSDAMVYQKFSMTGIPYFLGYDAEDKLVHRSTGAIKIEKVLADFDEK